MWKVLISLAVFFSFPFSAFAVTQFVSPATDDNITDTGTVFVFQTDDGGNQWTMWDGSGNYFCGDSIAGYGSPVSRSMSGWATACGTSITGTVGAFHLIVVSARISPCTAGGNYDDCVASAYYMDDDLCLNVGGTGFCTAPPPDPVATTSTSTGQDGDFPFLLSILLVLAFYAFIAHVYSLMFKNSKP